MIIFTTEFHILENKTISGRQEEWVIEHILTLSLVCNKTIVNYGPLYHKDNTGDD